VDIDISMRILRKIIKGNYTYQNGIQYPLSIDKQDSVLSKASHDIMATVEEDSFWYRHRKNVICRIVERYSARDNIIFDIGGANGYFSAALQEMGYVTVLFEPGLGGCLNAQKKGVTNIYNDYFCKENINRNSVNAILLLDVLEHIDDDVSFLEEIYQLLNGDGILYLTVPAGQFLLTKEEMLGGHKRRYNMEKLCKMLKTTGFNIEYRTYLFWFLPLPIFIIRKILRIKRRSNYSNQHVVSGLIGKIVNLLLSWEYDNIVDGKKLNGGGGGGGG
jgi:SAM-dependent methyltransferase